MTDDRSYLQALETSPLEGEWRSLLTGLSQDELAYRPAPEEWSILEILHHIGELEELRLRRIHAMLADTDPVLEARGELSPVPVADPQLLLDRWLTARAELLSLGRALDESQLDRPGKHPLFGPTSPRDQFQKSEPHARNHLEQCRANLQTFHGGRPA